MVPSTKIIYVHVHLLFVRINAISGRDMRQLYSLNTSYKSIDNVIEHVKRSKHRGVSLQEAELLEGNHAALAYGKQTNSCEM